MDNKDIEEELKKHSGELKMRDFSSHWEVLNRRMEEEQAEKRKVIIKQPALQPANNISYGARLGKSKIIIICVTLCLFIIAAIGLYFFGYLSKTDNNSYALEESDLTITRLNESNEFYSFIENSELDIININKFEILSYYVFLDVNEYTWGGEVAVASEELYYGTITFYSERVLGVTTVSGTVYNVSGTNVNYLTQDEDGLNFTSASANYQNVNYLIELYSLYEYNVTDFFDMLFA